jgi:hypothetical protein
MARTPNGYVERVRRVVAGASVVRFAVEIGYLKALPPREEDRWSCR